MVLHERKKSRGGVGEGRSIHGLAGRGEGEGELAYLHKKVVFRDG
mgnify:CR=1 FL=1